MHDCINDSGTFFMYENPGGSAEMKQRNVGCAVSAHSSRLRSSVCARKQTHNTAQLTSNEHRNVKCGHIRATTIALSARFAT